MEITTASEQKLSQDIQKETRKTEDKITINHTFESITSSKIEISETNSNQCETSTDDEKLSDSNEDFSFLASEADVVKEISQIVTALGHAFTKLVDIMLSVEIKVRKFKLNHSASMM